MSDFLHVNDLKVKVGEKEFIYNFSCNHNECIGILGTSGSGKTTFFRSITGLQKNMSGNILLDNADITKLPVHKRCIALMFQDYAIFDNINVEKNLKYVLLAKKIKRRDWKGLIEETLCSVKLQDKRKQTAGSLSGGEKQRLALARCLIIPPKLLLLDEPFNSLDEETKKAVSFNLTDILKKRNVTTLIVSHNKFELTDLIKCDKVIDIEFLKKRQVGELSVK